MNRQEANQELVNLLQLLIKENPDLRFGQILRNFRFIKEQRPGKPELCIDWQNEFFTEPQKVLERVIQAIEDYEEIKNSKG